MKLSVISGAELDRTFALVLEQGLDAVEYCVNCDWDAEQFLKSDVPVIREFCQEHGKMVASVGRWGALRLSADGGICPEALKHDKLLIDAAEKAGAPVYVCGCNWCDQLNFYENCMAAVRYLQRLIEYGRENGVRIAVYNCRWNNFIHSDPAWSVVLGALPELGIKYDVSHCRYDGSGDYLSEIRDWGERIYHMHIKGSMIIGGQGYDDPPAGLDQTDWRSVLSVLYTKGYDGALSIEPHSDRWKQFGSRGTEYAIQYIRGLLL